MNATIASRIVSISLFVLTATTVVALDLWTKDVIFDLLEVTSTPPPRPHVIEQERYVVLPGFFELEANYNYGAFSGWFSEHTGWLALLSGAALAVILGIFIHQLRRPTGPGAAFTLALALLWGGTLGNLHDRYYLGGVRDWIKWFYGTHVWPNFNIADSAICTGVGLLILLEVRNAIREKRAARREPAGAAHS